MELKLHIHTPALSIHIVNGIKFILVLLYVYWTLLCSFSKEDKN